MQGYHKLLIEYGFRDVTTEATRILTEQVREYKKGHYRIIIDGINLQVLKHYRRILHFPLNDGAICLALAYVLLPAANRRKYMLEDVRNYLIELPNNRKDRLQAKMMFLMFDLGLIRQNAL
jgi:hypothetical protein